MDFSKRLLRLQRELSQWEVGALLLENPIDLLYYTGLMMSAGALLVEHHSGHLFCDGRYTEMAKGQDLYSVVELASKETLVEKLPSMMPSKSRVGVDGDYLTWNQARAYSKN